jgi:hypothetical protein
VSPPQRFTITVEHVKLLQAANIVWQGDDLWGGPAFDAKRPLGVSGFQEKRIHELLGGDPHVYDAEGNLPSVLSDRYRTLYRDLDIVLRIVIEMATDGGVAIPGDYESDGYGRNWHRGHRCASCQQLGGHAADCPSHAFPADG